MPRIARLTLVTITPTDAEVLIRGEEARFKMTPRGPWMVWPPGASQKFSKSDIIYARNKVRKAMVRAMLAARTPEEVASDEKNFADLAKWAKRHYHGATPAEAFDAWAELQSAWLYSELAARLRFLCSQKAGFAYARKLKQQRRAAHTRQQGTLL